MSDKGSTPGPGSGDGVRLARPRIRAPGAGRPRKSAALHVLHGTRSRARKAPPAMGPGEVPVAPADIARELLEPPKWLHSYAKQLWRRIALPLATAGRLKLHHLAAFQSLCIVWSKKEREERCIGRLAVGSEMYVVVAQQYAASMRLWNTGCLRFGIDPAGDGRMSAIDGSEVAAGRPAPAAPAAASESDRGDTWLRDHGQVS